MPVLETDCLTQEAVLWLVTGKNRYNNPTLAAAVEILTRWETGNVETTDPLNATVAIDSTVVVDRVIAVGSIMRLGKLVDLPSPVDDLREVIDYKEIPDIKGRHFRRTVLLIKFSDTLPELT